MSFNHHNDQNQTYVIGVCGPSCGGKTTVCHRILDKIIAVLGDANDMICASIKDF